MSLLDVFLAILQAEGWSWTAGYIQGSGYEARIWKPKPGVQRSVNDRIEKIVVSGAGSSVIDALEDCIEEGEGQNVW